MVLNLVLFFNKMNTIYLFLKIKMIKNERIFKFWKQKANNIKEYISSFFAGI